MIPRRTRRIRFARATDLAAVRRTHPPAGSTSPLAIEVPSGNARSVSPPDSPATLRLYVDAGTTARGERARARARRRVSARSRATRRGRAQRRLAEEHARPAARSPSTSSGPPPAPDARRSTASTRPSPRDRRRRAARADGRARAPVDATSQRRCEKRRPARTAALRTALADRARAAAPLLAELRALDESRAALGALARASSRKRAGRHAADLPPPPPLPRDAGRGRPRRARRAADAAAARRSTCRTPDARRRSLDAFAASIGRARAASPRRSRPAPPTSTRPPRSARRADLARRRSTSIERPAVDGAASARERLRSVRARVRRHVPADRHDARHLAHALRRARLGHARARARRRRVARRHPVGKVLARLVVGVVQMIVLFGVGWVALRRRARPHTRARCCCR